MTDASSTDRPTDPVLEANRRSLQTLVRSIALSQEQFSLILVRCNYSRLRDQVRQQLNEIVTHVTEITVSETAQSLLTEITHHLQETNPQAIALLGLESVHDLESLLAGANWVRDEFRKTFSFPVVVWLNDQGLQTLTRVAPDLKSWATVSIRFTFPPDELIQSLRAGADRIFDAVLNVGSDRFLPNSALSLELGSRFRTELEFALTDIYNSGRQLDAELQASLDFVRGRDAHARLEMDEAKQYYERSLTFWKSISTSEPPPPPSPSSPHTPHPTPHTPHPSPHPLLPNSYLNYATLYSHYRERQGCLLLYLGLLWRSYAVLQRSLYETACRQARHYFEQCITVFWEDQREDLVAKFLPALGETLQKLGDWQALEGIARAGLKLHQINDPVRLARDYGFLAEVALAKGDCQGAKAAAERAIAILESAKQVSTNAELADNDLTLAEQYHRGLYLFLLARSLTVLKQPEIAIQQLQTAKDVTEPRYDPLLYIQILRQLRSLYFAEGHYLEAFHIKQEQRSVEQQFKLRAFLGAGRLEAQRILVQPDLFTTSADIIAQEIEASGRQRDVDRLMARISTPKDKLTVIHGTSGVGKSSIVNAGLIPALHLKTIEARRIIPLLLSYYTDWAASLDRCLSERLTDLKLSTPYPPPPTPHPPPQSLPPTPHSKIPTLLTELRNNIDRNLVTVLIFDQFEEFFFACPDRLQRKPFYEFLRECLNIPYVKVILSLREDFLHYLLEVDRLANLEVINHDILSKDIRYPLTDFSPEDARLVIQSLTRRAQFDLDDDLIDALVRDLAGELGEVRPIELQVVGAQLQEDKITTLAQYQRLGSHPKETLVQRSLQEVIKDCGAENEAIAQLVLFLLTDENDTRPLKTLTELTEEITLAGIPFETQQLELVLAILVGSGLVYWVPEVPSDRYQLVHDYLVSYIRKQQESGLMAELQAEREKRKLTEEQLRQALREKEEALEQEQQERLRAETAEIDALCSLSQSLLLSKEPSEALFTALKAGSRLQNTAVPPKLKYRTLCRLWQAIYDRKERDLWRNGGAVFSVCFSPEGNILAAAGFGTTAKGGTVKLRSLKGNSQVRNLRTIDKAVLSLAFSPDGSTLAFASNDFTVQLWNMEGSGIRTLGGHQDWVNSVCFSPDGGRLASGSRDKTIKLWSVDQGELKTLTGHDDSVNSVCFSPDGKWLVSGSTDRTIRLWNLETDTVQTWIDHQDWVNSVCFSPDGTVIASASTDRTIKLWSLDGQGLQIFRGHQAGVNSLAFSPDGQTIASGSTDRTIKLWSIDGTELLTFKGHRDRVTSVAFNAEGTTLASGSTDSTVILWNLDLDTLMRQACEMLQDYLQTNLRLSEGDRHLCDFLNTQNTL